MITLSSFEDTIDLIINKYNGLKYYYSCFMSENNYKFFIWSKYPQNIIKLLPTSDIKLQYIYFATRPYISDDKIRIFSGPLIATINIQNKNMHDIQDIIE